jgi:hypothetical protein
MMDSNTDRDGAEPLPAEVDDSVAAVRRSIAQAMAGNFREMDEVFDELETRLKLKVKHT